jgi:hypothetical protein
VARPGLSRFSCGWLPVWWLHHKSVKTNLEFWCPSFKDECEQYPMAPYLLCFTLIRWGASQVQFYFFWLKWDHWIDQSLKKKWNFLSCPKEKVLVWSIEFLPFGPSERRIKFAKAYGIKVRCYWELFGKRVRNLGTLCFDCPAPPVGRTGIKSKQLPSIKWSPAFAWGCLH